MRYRTKRQKENRLMVRVLCTVLLILQPMLFTSCKQEDDVVIVQPARHWTEITVAVVAPLSDATLKTRLERTAEWFIDNFRRAQQNDTLAIRLKLEWYDELTANLATLSDTLARRQDVAAIIGPFDNDALAAFAPACQRTQKPLVTPTASAEEVIRRYAVKRASGISGSKPFLWALTESDVKLTEALMSIYATLCQVGNHLTTNAYLLSPHNNYGQTFAYWAPFFAENYNINLVDNWQYDSQEELFSYISSYMDASGPAAPVNFLSGFFTVIESINQLYDIALFRRKQIFDKMSLESTHHTTYDDPATDSYWQLYESAYECHFALNNLCEEKIEALGDRAYAILQGYQGFSPYADPTTGFELSYQNRFSTKPIFAECKFYDALMLVAFAACYEAHHSLSTLHSSFNQAIISITNGSGRDAMQSGAAWDVTPMEIYLTAMERGNLLHFKGASGDITFDPETFTSTTHTTYVHWQILDGQIHHRSYIGDTGSRRTEESYAAWQYLYDKNTAERDFDKQTTAADDLNYPALESQYAVLVQGSNGFDNYRHLSDVLSVYQMLRQNGYPDDHIILIADKTIANNAKNPELGVIRATADGADLLGGTSHLPAAQVDYDNAHLTPADISNILIGTATDRTPTVLPRNGRQNVLLYWSGHGRNGEFVWRNTPNGQGFNKARLKQTAQTMLDAQAPTCRKLLVVAEPCYGEGVVAALQGTKGALGISGANAGEQSWADNWSNTALVWLSDRFTQNFVGSLTANPRTSYRDLFLYCAANTLGSHAKIVNAANFGNLTTTNPSEFIIYNNK